MIATSSLRRFSLIAVLGWVIFGSLLATEDASAQGEEFIILSGGPALRKWENLRRESERHDRWWGNFIRTARIRIEQLRRAHGDGITITWLVYKKGYVKRGSEESRSLISLINSVKTKFNVNLIWFNTGDDVIRYINSGKDRRRTKIANFDFFGHSNRYCFLFDYSCDALGVSSSYLHEKDLHKLKRSAFLKDAYACSYGCHTGESMSAKFRRATGVKMRGALGKTDYSLSWKNQLPHINKGRWKY